MTPAIKQDSLYENNERRRDGKVSNCFTVMSPFAVFPFVELSDLDRQSLFVEDGIGEDGGSLFEKDVVVLIA